MPDTLTPRGNDLAKKLTTCARSEQDRNQIQLYLGKLQALVGSGELDQVSAENDIAQVIHEVHSAPDQLEDFLALGAA